MMAKTITSLQIKNTNCIICGIPFEKERASKLYCSPACRQSGYYHKDKIAQILNSESNGINEIKTIIRLKKYKEYLRYRDKLINYRRLQSNFRTIIEGSEEGKLLYDNPNCALTFERYTMPKKIWHLNPPKLSVEQWSFFDFLYPKFSTPDLMAFVCSLSSYFINQVISSNEETDFSMKSKFQPVKTKYLFHLHKIVEGQIEFI